MKVKKLTRSLKSRLGIKDLRVNLIRLDKNTIYRMIGMNKSVSTYNISMRLKNGEVVCVQDSGEALSMIITVKSIHPSSPPIPSTINSQPTSDMPMLQSSNQYYSVPEPLSNRKNLSRRFRPRLVKSVFR